MPCLNANAHPGRTEGCQEGCMMCCGYVSPGIIAILIAALALASDAYYIVLIVRNSRSAWRIVLSILFIPITSFFALVVLWAFKIAVFTSAGYVPADPWQHRPRYNQRGNLHQQRPGGEGAAGYDVSDAGQATNVLMASGADGNGTRADREDNKVEDAASVAILGEGATTTTRDSGGHCVSHSPYEEPLHSSPEQRAVKPRKRAEPREGSLVDTPREEEREESSGDAVAAGENPYMVYDLNKQGEPRFCTKCNQYKPDKAHHCSICGHCVYNFDHHCPFINNCVGRNNYKVFVVFLTYGGVGCVLAAAIMVIAVFAIDSDDIMDKVYWLVIPGLEVVLALSLGLFVIQHACRTYKGQTTLDSIVQEQHNNPWVECQQVFCGRGGGGGDGAEKPRKLTREEQIQKRVAEKEMAKRHRETLFGKEDVWWRNFAPIPVRTDDTADDTIKKTM